MKVVSNFESTSAVLTLLQTEYDKYNKRDMDGSAQLPIVESTKSPKESNVIDVEQISVGDNTAIVV